MFVEVFSNNGNKYLRLVEGYYTKDKNGNPTCRKKVIKSIGRLDKYDDGKPDFVKRLKESFVNGNPLIEELNNIVWILIQIRHIKSKLLKVVMNVSDIQNYILNV